MKIRPDSSLYTWNVDETIFDKTSLSWYFASGKFDKNSMSRWVSSMTKLKAQILRASIDNSMVFVPVGETSSDEPEILCGNTILICCNARIFAFGVVVRDPFVCPEEYKTTSYPRLVAVHILSTSFTEEMRVPHIDHVEESETLPQHVYKLTENVSEHLDVDIPNNVDFEYERHVFFSHWFMSFLKELEAVGTPVRHLECERLSRLTTIEDCFKKKMPVSILPPRVLPFQKMMKNHKKYAEMFGRLVL